MDEYIPVTFTSRRVFDSHRSFPQDLVKMDRSRIIYDGEDEIPALEYYLAFWIYEKFKDDPVGVFEMSESLFIPGAIFYIFDHIIKFRHFTLLEFACAQESVKIRIADHAQEYFWKHFDECETIGFFEPLKTIYKCMPPKWLIWDRIDSWYDMKPGVIIWILEQVTVFDAETCLSLLSTYVENEDSEAAATLIRRFPDIFKPNVVEAELRRSFCLAESIIACIRAADENDEKLPNLATFRN